MEKELLLATAASEYEELVKRNPGWMAPVQMDFHVLMSVVGALQLAMRHPGFQKTRAHGDVRAIVNALITAVPSDMPVTRKLLELGDNPNYDT